MERVKTTRLGAYGILKAEGKLLLTLKKAGPYQGLWDLPGGGIEFGESPEEALIREFKEETALQIKHLELIHVASKQVDDFFHHVGVMFKIYEYLQLDHPPEEEMRWIDTIPMDQLTPFAYWAIQRT